MKLAIVALLVGLALGYYSGYGDGTHGRPSVATRALNAFGISKVTAAQRAREKSLQDASKP
jgi:hypothetical protein